MKVTIWYLVIALFLLLFPCKPQDTHEPKNHNVWLITNGVHSGFVMEAELLQDLFSSCAITGFEKNKYVGIGWGELDFFVYTPEWKDLTFKGAVKAMLWPSASAIRLTAYQRLGNYSQMQKLRLTDTQLTQLLGFFKDELNLTRQKSTLITNDGRSNYYLANRSYHLFRTCNEWTNQALAACGQRHLLWTPFDFGLFN